MKRTIRYKYTPKKFVDGGMLASAAMPLVDPLTNAAFGDMSAEEENGDGINNKKSMWKSAASGAAKGALAGSFLGPWGTAAGGLIGGTIGLFTGKKQAAQADEAAAAQAAQEAEMQAQLKAQQDAIKAAQQDAYNKAYNAANPINTSGQIMKYGGNIMAQGGSFKPLATNVVKAEGKSHEQGGIDLSVGGKPLAEIEGGEVMKGTKVYSDSKKIDNKTYAEQAEKLAKEKAKWEAKANSTSNLERNTALRSIQNIDKQLEELFAIQEASKTPEQQSQTYALNGADLAMGLQMVTPMIDNAYNAFAINKTPEIAAPTMRQAEMLTAMPMKTTYNINPQLAEIESGYKGFIKDVNDNTASSNVARGNKMTAFAKTLQEKNRLAGEKENIETNLANLNSRNIQDVSARNVANSQQVNNQNLALIDDYNMRKVMREDNMLRNRMQNVANLTDDITMGLNNYAKYNSDLAKIETDLLNTGDAAGIANMIGTNTMDKLVKNPEVYQRFYDLLDSKGQKAALEKFKNRYGNKKKG